MFCFSIINRPFCSVLFNIGAQGDDVERELLALTASLPSHWDRVASSLRELSPVLAFHEQYEAFVRGVDGAGGAADSRDVNANARFPLLAHLLARGNSTVFELLRGRAPSRIESLVTPAATTSAAIPAAAAPPQCEQSTANSAADEVLNSALAFSVMYSYCAMYCKY